MVFLDVNAFFLSSVISFPLIYLSRIFFTGGGISELQTEDKWVSSFVTFSRLGFLASITLMLLKLNINNTALTGL